MSDSEPNAERKFQPRHFASHTHPLGPANLLLCFMAGMISLAAVFWIERSFRPSFWRGIFDMWVPTAGAVMFCHDRRFLKATGRYSSFIAGFLGAVLVIVRMLSLRSWTNHDNMILCLAAAAFAVVSVLCWLFDRRRSTA